jgi:hypothetical protein
MGKYNKNVRENRYGAMNSFDLNDQELGCGKLIISTLES